MGNCKDGMFMKKEDPYRVQAELQKQRLKKVIKEEEKGEERVESSLPSRSTVHKNKKKKIKVPIISILAFLFVLLPVVLLFINSLVNGKDFSNLLTTENTSGLFENVNIQKENAPSNESKRANQEEQQEIVIENNTTEEEETIAADNAKGKVLDEEEDKSKEEEKSKSEQPTNNVPKKEEPKEEPKDEEVEAIQPINPDEKIVYHTVAKGETLYRIALKYYPSGDGIAKIKAANNMNTDQVQLGQSLKIVLEP